MSLRARLLVGMAVVALVLAVAAVATTRTTRANLVDEVDEELLATGVGRPGRFGDRPPRAAFSSAYVGVVTPDGRLRTLIVPNLREDVPVPELTAEQASARAGQRPFTTGSDDPGTRYRAVAVRQDGAVLVVALPLDSVDAAVRRLVAVEVAATALVLAVLGLVTWWVLRLGVRPVKEMTAAASAIAAGDLSHRMPDAPPGTEAGDLGDALNRMLGRIEQAFDERARSEDRLRRFVADASHELRTPVTTIRGYAELHRTGGLTDPADLGEAMRRTEEEAVRMGRLVDDLLLLARLDQGRPLEREPVDFERVVADAVRDARAVDPDRPVTSRTDGPVIVLGDDGRLRQVVANLVGNALAHTPPGTPVEVRLSGDGDRAVVEVVDRGPGMPAEAAGRAFERFYRADPSRSRHGGGSGLGLAIVKATVEAHGGTVSLASAVGDGTTVRVELPRSG